MPEPNSPVSYDTAPSSAAAAAPESSSAPGGVPSRTTASKPPTSRIAVGLLLVFGGLAWLAHAAGLVSWQWPIVLAGGLAAVGAALIAVSPRGGHDGLVFAGIVLAALALTAPFAPTPDALGDFGQRTVRPATSAELDEPLRLSAGSLTVDLRDLAVDEPTNLEASVGMGELIVLLPDDASVAVRASAGAGEVNIGGRTRGGLAPALEDTITGSGALWELDLRAGIGQVEVRP